MREALTIIPHEVYSKARKYVYSCLTNQPTTAGEVFLIGGFRPNLATLQRVNLIVGFTIIVLNFGQS